LSFAVLAVSLAAAIWAGYFGSLRIVIKKVFEMILPQCGQLMILCSNIFSPFTLASSALKKRGVLGEIDKRAQDQLPPHPPRTISA
jgi:hypothetical protein